MLKLAWRGVRHNPSRYIATLVAISIGVAFFASTGFLGDRILDSMEGNARRQFDPVDAGVARELADDQSVYIADLRLPGEVAEEIEALDSVQGSARILIGGMALRDASGEIVAESSVGRLWIDDEELNHLEILDGRAPSAAGEIAVATELADELDLSVGSAVTALSFAGEIPVTVVGITSDDNSTDTFALGGTISVPATVANDWLSGGTYEFDGLYIRGAESQQAMVDQIQPILPPGFEAMTGATLLQDQLESWGVLGTYIKLALQSFALVAMSVGAFVIYNTFSVLVAQRLKELAVLRAIGATPKQVRRALRLEGVVVGLVGSVIGVLIGIGLVYVLDAILKALGLDLPGSKLVLRTPSIVTPLLLGTFVTVLSVMIPARRAARTEPIEAMRDAAVEAPPFTRKRQIFMAIMLMAGLAMLFLGSRSVFIGGGVLAMFLGTVAAGPALAIVAARLTKPLATKLGLEGRLASDNIARNPLRTATTANALLIGVFLVTTISVAGGSLREFAVEQIQSKETADYLLASDGGTLDDELVENLRSVDGVEVVEPFRRESIAVNGRPAFVSTADAGSLLDITGIKILSGSVEDLGPGTIVVREEISDRVGDTVTLSGPGGTVKEFGVAAVLGGSDSDFVGNLLTAADFDSLVGETASTVAFIDVEAGFRSENAKALESFTKGRPDLELIDSNSIGKLINGILSFAINAVNGLLGMSVLIAIVGIINTLTLSIFERRRELGLLRVVGMKDQDVQRMVRYESVLISILGTLTGLGLGVFCGWAVIASIRRLTTASIATDWVISRLIIILVLGIVLGAVAAFIPSRRSTRLDLLEAIQA